MFLNVNGGLSSEFINAFKDETNPLMVKLQTSTMMITIIAIKLLI